MSLSSLPVVNACLNGLSAVLLSVGYYFIRHRNQKAHRNCIRGLHFVPGLLYHLSQLPRLGPPPGPDSFQGAGRLLADLRGDSSVPHRPGHGDCPAGAHHPQPRP